MRGEGEREGTHASCHTPLNVIRDTAFGYARGGLKGFSTSSHWVETGGAHCPPQRTISSTEDSMIWPPTVP